MQAQIETSQQIQGYVRAVQQRALESARVVQDMNNKSQDLQTELILDEASDNLQRDLLNWLLPLSRAVAGEPV